LRLPRRVNKTNLSKTPRQKRQKVENRINFKRIENYQALPHFADSLAHCILDNFPDGPPPGAAPTKINPLALKLELFGLNIGPSRF